MRAGGRRGRWAAALVLAVAGCTGAPPVPVDRFYRLPEPERREGAAPARAWGDAVLVEALRANGLHTERALVFAEDERAIALMRYHYHHWVDGPPRLVQEYIASRIRVAAPESVVLTEPLGPTASVVSGKVKRFDHHVHGGSGLGQVLVTLELRLSRAGRPLPLIVKDYAAAVPVAEDGMTATVGAFAQAMEAITDQFLRDAEDALGER